MRNRVLLSSLLILVAAFSLAACGGGRSDPKVVKRTPVALPTAGPAGTMPIPVPVDLPADVAFLGTPDEATSRVALATLQATAATTGLDALIEPLAGLDQSLLMIEIENSKAPSTRDDGADLRGLAAIPAQAFIKQFNVGRISMTIRDSAVVSFTASVSLATFQSRISTASQGPNMFKTVFADEPGQASDPLYQAAKMAPQIYQNRILAERARAQALVTTDPAGMDKAIQLQPYNVKYYLDKAQMLAANGDNADQAKGQALYLLQKQAVNGKIPTSLGPQTPEYIYVTRYASTVLDRALGYKPYDTPHYLKLQVEYCAQDQLAKKLFNFPLAAREVCG